MVKATVMWLPDKRPWKSSRFATIRWHSRIAHQRKADIINQQYHWGSFMNIQSGEPNGSAGLPETNGLLVWPIFSHFWKATADSTTAVTWYRRFRTSSHCSLLEAPHEGPEEFFLSTNLARFSQWLLLTQLAHKTLAHCWWSKMQQGLHYTVDTRTTSVMANDGTHGVF